MTTSTEFGTVVGVFENNMQAQKAVNELRKAGYADDQIGVVSHNKDGSPKVADGESGTKVEEGAIAGLATGAGVGALYENRNARQWGAVLFVGDLPFYGLRQGLK